MTAKEQGWKALEEKARKVAAEFQQAADWCERYGLRGAARRWRRHAQVILESGVKAYRQAQREGV